MQRAVSRTELLVLEEERVIKEGEGVEDVKASLSALVNCKGY
jgi:hypothetical protein